ncbi:MAG TPA: asparaginase [Candidatus Omnitrophota bacterium]|nr:asparaginase [Candidatus Omnitrophota bacterium]
MGLPIVIEILRGGLVESRHLGNAAVCDPAGAVVAEWGDSDRPTFPRSAIKPIQALPLVESGAADAFALTDEELALATASHSGEPMHTERVARWLARIGLGPEALECGAGDRASPLHNNCSGKHAGFLTVARHLGIRSAGYIRHDHPVQQMVSAAIAEATGTAGAPWGTDGCGIPTFSLPLSGIARAMAGMTTDRPAAARIVAAMRAHPHLVAGTNRLCTRFMQAVPGIVVKGGAEGVYGAIVPKKGWGVALKIEDGAGRAAEAAILAVLAKLKLVSEERASQLTPEIRNAAGKIVGEVRVTV